jgi:hypothetical protein
VAAADQHTQLHVPLQGCFGEICAGKECDARVGNRGLDVHQARVTLLVPRPPLWRPLQEHRLYGHHAPQLVTLAVDLLGAVRFPVAQHHSQRHAARERNSGPFIGE